MGLILARAKSQSIPRVRVLPLALVGDGDDEVQSFPVGTPMVVTDGKYVEAAEPPTAIAAVSESGAGPDVAPFTGVGLGAAPLGTREFPPGQMVGTAVQDEVVFRAPFINPPMVTPEPDSGPAIDVAAILATIGEGYGLVKDGTTGDWAVDLGETTTTQVILHGLLDDVPNAPGGLREVLVFVDPEIVQNI